MNAFEGEVGEAFGRAAVARIWKTEIDLGRTAEYEAFAETRSEAMFRRQSGLVAALVCGRGAERAVITLWRDQASVDALSTSETYHEIVREIEAAGFLVGEQTTEVFQLQRLVVPR